MIDHLTRAEQVAAALLVLCTLAGGAWGWVTKIKPRFGRVMDVWGALVELLFGRPEEPENPITGAPAVPAVLGIGPRLTQNEQTTELLVKNVALLTEQGARNDEVVRQLVDLRQEVGEIHTRLNILEEARAERVVAQAESAAMWSAVAAAQNTDDGHDKPGPAPDAPPDADKPQELP